MGWSGDRLTLNGAPKFLLMVSYFDALDVPYDRLVRDLSQFRAWGIDGVRILPNWLTYVPSTYAGDTVIDEAGNLRPGPLANLEFFISMAGDYGLIVDVTLTADTIGPADQPANPSQSSINYDNYKQGVGALISHLNAHGHFNVMYDLQNEHTRGGNGPQNINLSPGQLADLVAYAKNFTDQPVFVSVEQSHSASFAGNEAFNTGQNAVAYHEPRLPVGGGNTGAVVNDARNASGGKPVYLQEPGRIGDPGSCCSAGDFRAAYDAAANAGAAAWTFHTQAGHYMNVDDYLDRLAPAETQFLSTVRSGGGGSGGSTLTAGQQLAPGQSEDFPERLLHAHVSDRRESGVVRPGRRTLAHRDVRHMCGNRDHAGRWQFRRLRLRRHAPLARGHMG